MISLLIIDPNIHNLNYLVDSITSEYNIGITSNISNNVNRLGLIWKNNNRQMPFGSTDCWITLPDIINNESINDKLINDELINDEFVDLTNKCRLFYFTQEIIDLIGKNNITIVDLITCNLGDPVFLSDLEHIKYILPNVQFNFSTQTIGNTYGPNWTLTSNNINLMQIYFNSNILTYPDELDDTILNSLNTIGAFVFDSKKSTYNLTSPCTISSWSGIINLPITTSGIIINGNDQLITISSNITNFSGLFTGGGNNLTNILTLTNFKIQTDCDITLGGALYNNSSAVVGLYIQISNSNSINNGLINFRSGGLVGLYAGYSGTCIITKSYSINNKSIKTYAGGLIGYSAGRMGLCTISNSYVINNALIDSYAGGLVGSYAGYDYGSCIMTNVYSTNNSSIGISAGGLIGSYAAYNYGSLTLSNAYCVNNSSINGGGGGFIGSNAGNIYGLCIISNAYCINNGSINTNGGGFIGNGSGLNNGLCIICNVYVLNNSTLLINGTNKKGGIFTGSINNFIKTNCIAITTNSVTFDYSLNINQIYTLTQYQNIISTIMNWSNSVISDILTPTLTNNLKTNQSNAVSTYLANCLDLSFYMNYPYILTINKLNTSTINYLFPTVISDTISMFDYTLNLNTNVLSKTDKTTIPTGKFLINNFIYIYIGTYLDKIVRAIPNESLSLIQSMGQALSISATNNYNLFGLQNNSKLFYGGTIQSAEQYGSTTFDNQLGTTLNNNVFINTTNISQFDLTNCDLTNCDLSNCDLTNCNLTNTNLTNANLTNTNLTNANLTNANLTNCNLTNANLTNANLTHCDLTNCNFTNTMTGPITIVDTNPTLSIGYQIYANSSNQYYIIGPNINLSNVDLTNCDFTNYDLTNCNFTNCNLTNANLTNANLTNVNLTNANLTNVNFTNTKTGPIAIVDTNPTLSYEYQIFASSSNQYYIIGPNINLSNVNLTNSNLTNYDLTNANLTNANLTNTRFINTNLTNADLTNINLTNAILVNTILTNVNLTNADLTNANLTNANLTNADFTNANFTNTITGPIVIINTNPTLSIGYQICTNSSNQYYMIGPNINLSNVDLTNCDLTNCDLTNCNLINCNLTNANLTNVNLTNAKTGLITIISIPPTLPNGYKIYSNLSNQYCIIGPNVDLSNVDFTNCVLTNDNLTNCNLTNVNLTNCDLTNANLTNCNFTNAITGPIIIVNSNPTLSIEYRIYANLSNQYYIIGPNINLSNIDLTNINLSNVNLSNSNLSNINLTNANLINCNLTSCDLTNANLTNANLTNCYVINCNCGNVNFTNCNLTNADFTDSTLINSVTGPIIIIVINPRLPIIYQIYTNSLNQYYIIGLHVNLTNCDLTNYNLTNCNLTDSNLTNCNLTNVNLTDANLTNVNLTNANLTNVNLTNCNLTNANITNAILTDTLLFDIVTDILITTEQNVEYGQSYTLNFPSNILSNFPLNTLLNLYNSSENMYQPYLMSITSETSYLFEKIDVGTYYYYYTITGPMGWIIYTNIQTVNIAKFKPTISWPILFNVLEGQLYTTAILNASIISKYSDILELTYINQNTNTVVNIGDQISIGLTRLIVKFDGNNNYYPISKSNSLNCITNDLNNTNNNLLEIITLVDNSIINFDSSSDINESFINTSTSTFNILDNINSTINSNIAGGGLLNLNMNSGSTLSIKGIIDGSLVINGINDINGIQSVVIITGNIIGPINVNSNVILIVNSSIDSNINMNSNSVLKGNGTVLGNIILNSGAGINVGNSPGYLIIDGDLTINSESIIYWEIDGNDASLSNRGILYDAIDVSGTLTIANDNTVKLSIQLDSNVNFSDDFWHWKIQTWNFIHASNYQGPTTLLTNPIINNGSNYDITMGNFNNEIIQINNTYYMDIIWTPSDLVNACVDKNVDVLISDGINIYSKKIIEIIPGDLVVEDIKTKKLNKVCKLQKFKYYGFGNFIPENLISNTKPIICSEHPIWINNDTNRIFPSNIKGVEQIMIDDYLYDIQFNTEGTFYVNGIKVDSLSPYYEPTKLPEHYFVNPEDYNKYVYTHEDEPMRNKPLMTNKFN